MSFYLRAVDRIAAPNDIETEEKEKNTQTHIKINTHILK